jgi:hypothetical protein
MELNALALQINHKGRAPFVRLLLITVDFFRFCSIVARRLFMEQNGEKYILLTSRHARDLNPSRYIVPPGEALSKLHGGHVVKLVVDSKETNKGEEVWVTITHRNQAKFIGMIYGQLVRTKDHGLALGNPIQFRLEHIVDIYFQAPPSKEKPLISYKIT